jgi:hypothetical protein
MIDNDEYGKCGYYIITLWATGVRCILSTHDFMAGNDSLTPG